MTAYLTHLPSELPVANKTWGIEESGASKAQLIAVTQELCALRIPMSSTLVGATLCSIE